MKAFASSLPQQIRYAPDQDGFFNHLNEGPLTSMVDTNQTFLTVRNLGQRKREKSNGSCAGQQQFS